MSYYTRFGRVAYPEYDRVDDCVCDTVRKIIKAQNKVADDDCSTSCDNAIEKLRRPGSEHGPQYTTIPFVLYSKGTCKPFIGSGIYNNHAHKHNDSFFGCVETPVFRANHFMRNSDCCVKLELLAPAAHGCEIKGNCMDKAGGACSFFPEDTPITGFFSTGICITVDLKQFMGISCLDPVNTL